MIILRNKDSEDFSQDGFSHSRKPNKELTDEVRDLDLTVSSYTCPTVKGEMQYLDVWLNEDPSKFFWLGNFDSLGDKNDTGWHGWGIHFRTYEDNFDRHKEGNARSVITEEQKRRLFEGTSRIIPKGGLLSTYGTISPGGVRGLERFGDLGFKRVGTAYPKDDSDHSKVIAVPIWKKL